VIELREHGTEAGLDVAQAFAIGQLREDHGQILIPTGEAAQVCIASVSDNAFLKFLVRHVLDELREDGATLVHAPLFRCGR
jgi:cobyrinic acid a,c-diamide synthase